MIRKATINDAKEIIKINVNGWKKTYKNIFPKDFLDNLNQNDKESIKKCRDKISQYAVCEINNKVVAMIRYGKNKKNYDDLYAEIYALYVDDNYKKKRIGTELIKFAFNELKEEYNYVLISTLVENTANEFYKKTGGKLIGSSNFILENKEYLENVYCYKINKSDVDWLSTSFSL